MATPYELQDRLRELALFPPTAMPVLSVYLNTQPDQHGRRNFSPFLRKELKNRADTYPPDSEERRSFEQDARRIETWLDNDLHRSSNGAAIGVHDVMAALANGQADTVFISADLEQIHPEAEDLHPALAPPVAGLPAGAGVKVSDELVTRAYQTGARVRFIEDPALLAQSGGVCAGLRYRL